MFQHQHSTLYTACETVSSTLCRVSSHRTNGKVLHNTTTSSHLAYFVFQKQDKLYKLYSNMLMKPSCYFLSINSKGRCCVYILSCHHWTKLENNVWSCEKKIVWVRRRESKVSCFKMATIFILKKPILFKRLNFFTYRTFKIKTADFYIFGFCAYLRGNKSAANKTYFQ